VEWADNEKLTDTRLKGIRAIPKGFSYIHVDFDGRGGFAHVVQEAKYFRRDLCGEVVAAVVGADPFSVRR
jgi:hypothetical protein